MIQPSDRFVISPFNHVLGNLIIEMVKRLSNKHNIESEVKGQPRVAVFE